MDITRCTGCGAPAEWVLWRQDRRSDPGPRGDEWEAVAEGTETEVGRQHAAVPLTGNGYAYTKTSPCEKVPGISMPRPEPRDGEPPAIRQGYRDWTTFPGDSVRYA